LRPDDNWGTDGQRAAILGTQPAAEKFPVNFLLFTGSTIFALLKGCALDGTPIGYGLIQ
jgi:hypothetical protein